MITSKQVKLFPPDHWLMMLDREDPYYFDLKDYDFRPRVWDMLIAIENKKLQRKIKDVSLALVPIRDLGFKKRSPIQSVIKEGLRRGFRLCPPMVGPSLRFQYDRKSKQEIFVAMKPITIIANANPDDDDVQLGIYPSRYQVSCIFHLTKMLETPVLAGFPIQEHCDPKSIFVFYLP